jgi:nanoRNase/pAp phosphatase (c-di-AMP/oligoRNAs hydrolase)
MLRRLVLGCAGVGSEVVRTVSKWPGELRVVDDDAGRVESLRDRGVLATEADPTDPEHYPETVDVVFVAGADPETNRVATQAAREAYPDALLVTYTGTSTEASVEVDRIRGVADEVIEPRGAMATWVSGLATGDTADRTHRLLRVLRTAEGPMAVVAHDNPDPDAIASAVGVCRLAEEVGLDARACYFGDISHQENRALVNLLDLPLHNLDGPEDLEGFQSVALVDHSRPGVNDQLPEDTAVDIVIDHHPPRAPVEARFVDLRSDAGATSTLITEHLDRLGLDVGSDIATALLYGIQVDTSDFTREVSEADFEAAATLLNQVDSSVLEQVESPSVTADVLETIARAIRDRTVRGAALSTCVGPLTDRDALAQAADRLLDMDGVRTTLVYGFMDGTVFLSGRARGADIDLGETLRDAFDQIGSAGGHADMAGAQIPLGILGDVEDEEAESLTRIVRDVIDDRFFDSLEGAPSVPTSDEGLTYEFPDDEGMRATLDMAFSPVGADSGGDSEGDGATEENKGADGDGTRPSPDDGPD